MVKVVLMFAILFLVQGCAHKIMAKNCEPVCSTSVCTPSAVDHTMFFVCESLGITE